MLHSSYRALCAIRFPDFRNRDIYMQPFDLSDPKLPSEVAGYRKPVRELCKAPGYDSGIAWLTVDEKLVRAGRSQRRPHPHVDGRFIPEQLRWGHDGPKWIHCGQQRMEVIVAASVIGCRVWKGSFDAEPTDCGDLSHISDQLGTGEILAANRGYLLSADCVHESMVFEKDTIRQFIRIALPN